MPILGAKFVLDHPTHGRITIILIPGMATDMDTILVRTSVSVSTGRDSTMGSVEDSAGSAERPTL